ncbi:arginine N-methyltransferase [Acrasis kona]|uniref:Arginine N-methyltransferase n=1 Tax=Acrasis kona TaxID=1008807 RepID=A0AAW2ZPF9_9EUKA
MSICNLQNPVAAGYEVGKFFKILDGEQSNEQIMQKKRTHFKNQFSDEDITTEDYFAAQQVTLIVGVIKQLKEISQTSQSLFNELLSESQTISERIENINSRAKACRQSADALKKKTEKEPNRFLKNKRAPKITFADPPTFLFDASTASKEFLNAYDAAKPIPISISELDVFEEQMEPRLNQDTLRSYVQRYSDPYRIYQQFRESKLSLSEVKKKEERARRQNKREAKKMTSPEVDMRWKDRLDKHGFAAPSYEPTSPNIAHKAINLSDPQPPHSYQEDVAAQNNYYEEPVYQSNEMRFVAIYDFTSDDPQELCFMEGDEIIISQQDGEWWWGEKDGRQGYVPANHLQEIGASIEEGTHSQEGTSVEEPTVYEEPAPAQEEYKEEMIHQPGYQDETSSFDAYQQEEEQEQQPVYVSPPQVVSLEMDMPLAGTGTPPPPPPPPLIPMEQPRTNISDLHAAIKQGVTAQESGRTFAWRK